MDDLREKTCCLTGHRVMKDSEMLDILLRLRQVLERLIARGVSYFGCGGALGFDMLAAREILRLREIYPQIKLILVLPCQDQDSKWHNWEKAEYKWLKQQADKIIYTAEAYHPGCMQKRNRRLVDASAYCVCYLKHDRGGTAYTVRYAEENGLAVTNLYTGSD